MKSKIYLVGSLNGILYHEAKGLYFSQGESGEKRELDNYTYSQLRAINPELKDVSKLSKDELFPSLYLENTLQKALNQALELMDPQFSNEYKEKIARHLVEKVNSHSGVIDFISNRFYSNILPKTFDPHSALYFLENTNAGLRDIFTNLKLKSEAFAQLYSVIRTLSMLEKVEQEQLDSLYTQQSVYSNFVLAIYHSSGTLYDQAVQLALRHRPDHLTFLDNDFFKSVKQELVKNYQVKFAKTDETLPIIANTDKHRFYGSPLKTIYQCFTNELPLTGNQALSLLKKTFPYSKNNESQSEYKYRIHDQLIDEIEIIPKILASADTISSSRKNQYFFSSKYNNNLSPWPEPPSRKKHTIAELKALDPLEALIEADSYFVRHFFSSCITRYKIILKTHSESFYKSPNFEDFSVILISGIKLGVSFEKLNKVSKAAQTLQFLSDLITKCYTPTVLYKHSVNPEYKLQLFKPSQIELITRSLYYHFRSFIEEETQLADHIRLEAVATSPKTLGTTNLLAPSKIKNILGISRVKKSR